SQAISGDVVGTVLDASGSVVPNPTIKVINAATGVGTEVKGGARGEYRISNLPPGSYDLTASATGFAESTLKGVAVQLNQTATVNITLRISSVSTAVEVTAAPSVIDTTTAQIQGTFTTRQATDLPIASITNGVLNLSLLQAGVGSNGGVGVGTGPSVGGQRPRNNNFTVEGVDDNNKSVTGPTVTIPNQSVAEFTLIQNEFQAEYGHSSGGQFNTVVRSGTNHFHGALYEYMLNRNLNALDEKFAHQNLLSNQRYDQNHLGVNFGGPIKHDKLFYFGSFEYNPLGRASTNAAPLYAPTASGYAALAAIPGVSQTNLGVLKQYAVASAVTDNAPSIAVGGVTVPTGIIPISAPNYTNAYYGVL
ncbi:MAG: carboxypeptidase-like regulatory domain-containing protein, partial [bacterium]